MHSDHSDRGTTPQHPEQPPAEKGAQSGRPLVDLRREARERDAVSAQVLHSFLFGFVPSKLAALVRRERVGSLGLGERSGLVAGFVFAPPKVSLQRVDENLDVPFLHVRVLAGSIFVVWVTGSVAPSLFELLPDVLQRVDHDAEVIEPLFGDGTAA